MNKVAQVYQNSCLMSKESFIKAKEFMLFVNNDFLFIYLGQKIRTLL